MTNDEARMTKPASARPGAVRHWVFGFPSSFGFQTPSSRPTSHREQDVRPQRLVASLNGEHMVGRFDRLVKVPFRDRLQLEFESGLPDGLAKRAPDGRFALLRVGIV